MPKKLKEEQRKAFVLGQYMKPTVEAFLQLGGSLTALATAIGKSELWLYSPPSQIAISEYLQLFQTARELCDDPYLGLRSGQLANLDSFGVLGNAISLAKTLAEALHQVMILERLVHRLGTSSIQMEKNNLRVIWRSNYRVHGANQLICENVLSGIVQLAQQLTGRSIPVLEMTFEHPPSDHYLSDRYQVLCQGKCSFSQPYNSLLIAADVLAWPLSTAGTKVKKVTTESVTAQLTDLLSQRLMNNPRLGQIAAIMGLSERSLQRTLKHEGQSFQQLLANVRLRQARDYLRYSTMSPMQISQMLGFCEQSSFNHFFLDKMGQSPKQYRQQTSGDTKGTD